MMSTLAYTAVGIPGAGVRQFFRGAPDAIIDQPLQEGEVLVECEIAKPGSTISASEPYEVISPGEEG